MRKYQPWAIVLIVAYLLVSLPNPLVNYIMASLLSPAEYGVLSMQAMMLAGGRALLRLIVSIIVAVWLYRLAQRDGGAPWVWAMLGLFFNLIALVLYFALQIYERLRDPATCSACGHDNRESIRAGNNTCVECGRPLYVIGTQPVEPAPSQDVASGT